MEGKKLIGLLVLLTVIFSCISFSLALSDPAKELINFIDETGSNKYLEEHGLTIDNRPQEIANNMGSDVSVALEVYNYYETTGELGGQLDELISLSSSKYYWDDSPALESLSYYATAKDEGTSLSPDQYEIFWDFATSSAQDQSLDIDPSSVGIILEGYESLDKGGNGWGLDNVVRKDIRDSYESGNFISDLVSNLETEYATATLPSERIAIENQLNALEGYVNAEWDPDVRDSTYESTKATTLNKIKDGQLVIASSPTLEVNPDTKVDLDTSYDDLVAYAKANKLVPSEIVDGINSPDQKIAALVSAINVVQGNVPDETNSVTLESDSGTESDSETVTNTNSNVVQKTSVYDPRNRFTKLDSLNTPFVGSDFNEAADFFKAVNIITPEEYDSIKDGGITYAELNTIITSRKTTNPDYPYANADELFANLKENGLYYYSGSDDPTGADASNAQILSALNHEPEKKETGIDTEDTIVKKEIDVSGTNSDLVNTQVLALAKKIDVTVEDGQSREEVLNNIVSSDEFNKLSPDEQLAVAVSLGYNPKSGQKLDTFFVTHKISLTHDNSNALLANRGSSTPSDPGLEISKPVEVKIYNNGVLSSKKPLNFINGELDESQLTSYRNTVISYDDPYTGTLAYKYVDSQGDVSSYDVFDIDTSSHESSNTMKYVITGSSRGEAPDESVIGSDYKDSQETLRNDNYVLLDSDGTDFVFTTEEAFLKDGYNAKSVEFNSDPDIANRMAEVIYGDVLNRRVILKNEDGEKSRYIMDQDTGTIYELQANGKHKVLDGTISLDTESKLTTNNYPMTQLGSAQDEYNLYQNTIETVNKDLTDFTESLTFDQKAALTSQGLDLSELGNYETAQRSVSNYNSKLNNNIADLESDITKLKNSMDTLTSPDGAISIQQEITAKESTLAKLKDQQNIITNVANQINSVDTAKTNFEDALKTADIKIDDPNYLNTVAEITYNQMVTQYNHGRYTLIKKNKDLDSLGLSISNENDISNIAVSTNAAGEYQVVAKIGTGNDANYVTLTGEDAAAAIFKTGDGISTDVNENKYVVVKNEDGNYEVYENTGDGPKIVEDDVAKSVVNDELKRRKNAQDEYTKTQKDMEERINQDRKQAEENKQAFMTGLGDIFHNYLSAYEIEAADEYVEQACYDVAFNGATFGDFIGGSFKSSWNANSGWGAFGGLGGSCSMNIDDEDNTLADIADENQKLQKDCMNAEEETYYSNTAACGGDSECTKQAQDDYYAAIEVCKNSTIAEDASGVDSGYVLQGMMDGNVIGNVGSWFGAGTASCHPNDNAVSTQVDYQIFESSFGVDIIGKKYDSASMADNVGCSYLVSLKMTSVFPVRLAVTLQNGMTELNYNSKTDSITYTGNPEDNYLFLSGALMKYGSNDVNPNLNLDPRFDVGISDVRNTLSATEMNNAIMKNFTLLQPDAELGAGDLETGNFSLYARKYVMPDLSCDYKYYCYYAMTSGNNLGQRIWQCHAFGSI